MPEEGEKVRVVVGWARRLLHASRDMLGVPPSAFIVIISSPYHDPYISQILQNSRHTTTKSL